MLKNLKLTTFTHFQVLFHVEMEDAEPIDYLLNLCDAFEDEAIGKSFMDAGEPKDTFPKACPITEVILEDY